MPTLRRTRHARKSVPNHWRWYSESFVTRFTFWDSLCEMLSDSPAEKTRNLTAVVAAFRQITRHRSRPQLVAIAVRAINAAKKKSW